MRQWRVLAFVLGIAVLCVPTHQSAAVVPGELLLGVQGSVGLPTVVYPTPEFGDKVQPGWAIGLFAEKTLTNHFGVGVQFSGDFHKVDQKTLHDFVQAHGGGVNPSLSWQNVQLTAHARYYLFPQSPINPYAQVGVGPYASKYAANYEMNAYTKTVFESDRKGSWLNLGGNIGAGALVQISKDSFFSGEAILNNIFMTKKSVRFVNVSAGIIFRLRM